MSVTVHLLSRNRRCTFNEMVPVRILEKQTSLKEWVQQYGEYWWPDQ